MRENLVQRMNVCEQVCDCSGVNTNVLEIDAFHSSRTLFLYVLKQLRKQKQKGCLRYVSRLVPDPQTSTTEISVPIHTSSPQTSDPSQPSAP